MYRMNLKFWTKSIFYSHWTIKQKSKLSIAYPMLFWQMFIYQKKSTVTILYKLFYFLKCIPYFLSINAFKIRLKEIYCFCVILTSNKINMIAIYYWYSKHEIIYNSILIIIMWIEELSIFDLNCTVCIHVCYCLRKMKTSSWKSSSFCPGSIELI